LLAQLDFEVEESGGKWLLKGNASSISINEDHRPILLHTRLLQEFLVFGKTSAEVPAPVGVANHADLNGLDQDDHKQYLLQDGTRPLTGNWSAGNNKITNLAKATANGDALRYEQAIKVGDTAGGDLGGNYPAPGVIGLQKRPVSNANPQPDEVLTWDGSQWIPKPITPAEKIILPLVTITPIETPQFELWFHLEVPGNQAAVGEYTDGCIEVLQEIETGAFYVKKLNIRQNRKGRNVWELITDMPENQLLRFRFNLAKIKMEGGDSLKEYAQKSNIRFIGQDGKDIVTVFVQTI
jgi:hypothetical protein